MSLEGAVQRDVEELMDSTITTLRSGSNGLPLWHETDCVFSHCSKGASADNRVDDQICVTK
jgi:hypothetical protein